MDKAKNFDRKNCRLREMHTEIWEGFIFVNISGDAEPLHTQLTDLQKILANWQMAGLVPRMTPFIMINARTGKSIQNHFSRPIIISAPM